jgi:hypothetical protein
LHFNRTSTALKKALLIFLLSIQALFAAETGPNKQFYQVRDFKDDWQVYDDRLKAYVPYIFEQHLNYPAHTAILDIESNRNYYLLVNAKSDDNFLFIEGSLRQKVSKGKWLVLNIDSLYNVYRKQNIYITLYGSQNIDDKSIEIGHQKTINQKSIQLADEKVLAKPRSPQPFKNYFIIISVFILVIFSYLSNSYVRAFQRYYSIKDLFDTLIREQSFLINKPLSRMSIMFVIMLSMIIGLLYMFLQSRGIFLFGGRFILQEGETAWDLFTNYIRITLLAFGFMVLKYFFISMVGQLFNLEKVVDIHYFKIIQASIIFYTFLVGILLIFFTGYVSKDVDWTFYLSFPLISFYLLRILILYFTINRSLPIQSLYLISYLCIVELLPVVLGMRFAV